MRTFELAATTAWAIEEQWLRTILEIAARDGAGPEAVAAQLGRPLDNSQTVTVRDGIAIVPVTGPIFRYANLFSYVSGATSTEVLATDFNQALDDPAIRAIVLDIDSPGGEAAGVGEFAGMVYAARGRKPITAYIGGTGASAAYWVGSAADRVVVAPTAIVGSIGVVAAYRDTRARDERNGVKTVEFVSSQSPNKRPDPLTEGGRSQIQDLVDALAEVFVADVARNRGITPETVISDFGAGGTLVGRAAVEAGMADAVGTLEGVLADLQGRSSTQGARQFVSAYGKAPQVDEPRTRSGKEIRPMGLLDDIKGLFHARGIPVDDDSPTPAAPPAAGLSREDPRLTQLQAALEQERTARLQAEATAFANEATTAGYILPYERESAAALLLQAAQDDAIHPTAVKRVDTLKTFIQARKPHGLAQELLPEKVAGAAVLMPRPATTDSASAAVEKEFDAVLATVLSEEERLAKRRSLNGNGNGRKGDS